MSRLIDADEAIEYVNNLITVHRFYHPRSTTENFPISEVIAKINEVPTVDAVPVVHGHWIYKWNPYFKQELPYCSVCEKVSPSVSETDYCSHCGTKMDALAKDINVRCKTDEVTE